MENGVAVSMVDAVAQALKRPDRVLDCESSRGWSGGPTILLLRRWRRGVPHLGVLGRRASIIMPPWWRAWGWSAWWSVAGHAEGAEEVRGRAEWVQGGEEQVRRFCCVLGACVAVPNRVSIGKSVLLTTVLRTRELRELACTCTTLGVSS